MHNTLITTALHRLACAAPVCIFLLLGGCSQADQQFFTPITQSGARFEVRRAREAMAQQRHDSAVRAFSRAISLDPQSADAHAGLGELAALREDRATAIEHYRSAVKYDPGSYNYAIALANLLRDNIGEIPDESAVNATLRAFDFAHHLMPERPEPLIGMTMCQRLLGEYDTAMKHIVTTIRLNPGLVEAYNEKAAIYHARGEYRNALATYHKALELDSNNIDAHNGCGEIYTLLARSRGTKGSLNREQAIAHLRRSLQINDGQPRIHQLLDALTPYEYRGVSVSQQGK